MIINYMFWQYLVSLKAHVRIKISILVTCNLVGKIHKLFRNLYAKMNKTNTNRNNIKRKKIYVYMYLFKFSS